MIMNFIPMLIWIKAQTKPNSAEIQKLFWVYSYVLSSLISIWLTKPLFQNFLKIVWGQTDRPTDRQTKPPLEATILRLKIFSLDHMNWNTINLVVGLICTLKHIKITSINGIRNWHYNYSVRAQYLKHNLYSQWYK